MHVLLVAPLIPKDQLTQITTDWANQLQPLFHGKRCRFESLIGSQAVKKNVADSLKTSFGQMGLFIFLDHGSADELIGSDRNPLIDQSNAHLLRNKFVYAVACNSAQILGPLAIEKGAIGFLGFTDTFQVWSTTPGVFGFCLLSGLKAMVLEGIGAEQARERIIDEINQTLARLKKHPNYTKGAQSGPVAALIHNRESVVSLGDSNWRCVV